jgi:hypothetical protein
MYFVNCRCKSHACFCTAFDVSVLLSQQSRAKVVRDFFLEGV